MPMMFQLPEALLNQAETINSIPLKYRKLQLQFEGTEITFTSGAWGVFIHQQVKIGDHLYSEQYFEPSIDISLHVSLKEPSIVLLGVLLGNLLLKYSDGRAFPQAKKRALYYMARDTYYTAEILSGQKYHSVYIIPATSLLDSLTDSYRQLVEPLHSFKIQSNTPLVLPYRKFTTDARKELDKMKRSILKGQAGIIYYNNRISDFVLTYLEDIHREGRLTDTVTPQLEEFIKTVLEFPERPINVTKQAQKMGLTARAFETAFKAKKGTTVLLYIQQQRINKAKQLITGTDGSIASISLEVGYTDHSYFSKIFKRATGKTPYEYRKEN